MPILSIFDEIIAHMCFLFDDYYGVLMLYWWDAKAKAANAFASQEVEDKIMKMVIDNEVSSFKENYYTIFYKIFAKFKVLENDEKWIDLDMLCHIGINIKMIVDEISDRK